MKAAINNILLVLLAAVVITTTSGFAVYKHHCNTESITEFSVLVPAFKCNHNKDQHTESLPPCCASNSIDDRESCSNDDCCEIDSFIVKLDIVIDNYDVSYKLQLDSHTGPVLSDDVVKQFSDEISHIVISNDLPPPKSGKALRIYLHQLNIPYPSV